MLYGNTACHLSEEVLEGCLSITMVGLPLAKLLHILTADFVLVIVPPQIGEIKKGLKTFKSCGVSDYDYQRHIMFVQVQYRAQSPLCSATTRD